MDGPRVTMLAIVVPTFNERDNVRPLLARLHNTLAHVSYEVIFVDDDSPDGTARLVREIAQTGAPVRAIQRIGRRGLSSACIEGMLSCSAPYIAVIDADLQHDETKLIDMLAKMESGNFDVVVGSRHSPGGTILSGMNRRRTTLSNMGRRLAFKLPYERLSDPMSGFFMLRRSFFESVVHQLSGVGFKILLDIVLTAKNTIRIGEVPYEFRPRQHGSSKLDVLVSLEYLELLLDKLVKGRVSVRFLLFCLIGAVGVLFHLLLMAVFLKTTHMAFRSSQFFAAVTIMVLNYTLNNIVSYRDRRRSGVRYWTGLLGFCLACSVGLWANVSVAGTAYRSGLPWALSALIGLMFGAVWNFAATSVITWRENRKRRVRVSHDQNAAIGDLETEVSESSPAGARVSLV